MSVRKRRWTNAKGEAKESWVVDYVDAQGVRRLKTFAKKKDADAFRATSHVEVLEGTHVPDAASITTVAAGKLWLAAVTRAGREQSTVDQYRQHLDLHIAPVIGETKLTALNFPALRAFEEKLLDSGRSPAMVGKVLVSLGSLLADAQERGLVARNVVRDMRGRRGTSNRRAEKRAKGKLKVGTDIPAPADIKAIVAALEGRWRPILITAIFTGLRASELRGLRWDDVDLVRKVLHVRQRADRFNAIGKPKSHSGERELPPPPNRANHVARMEVGLPKGELRLVFPNGQGKVESLANIINRGLIPAQIRAGVTSDGKPKYTGMHALRHFYASWCINRSQDGGLGLPPKMVQERLGHATINLTMDTYSHLFPKGDDADEMAAAERALLT